MKMKQIIAISFCCLLLMGCDKDKGTKNDNSVSVVAIEAGDYSATIPFKSSSSAQQHQLRTTSLVDNMYIGSGLLQYAKQYFSSKSYTMQEGQFLAYDELSSLLGRESDENPDGLNPGSNVIFDTGKSNVKAPVIVRDIYEVDFIKEKEIKGIGLAIVLNRSVKDNDKNQQEVVISDEKIQAFGEETARRLVSYLRKFPEIGDQMPIYVALYKDTSDEIVLPGSFFSHSYFTGRSGNFSPINEKWVLFPSTEANQLDNMAATNFTQLKQSVNGYLPDDVGVIGKGHFVDNQLKDLHIEINMYAKTAFEAISLVQYVKSLIDKFSSNEYRIQIEIRNQNQTLATMVRNQGDRNIQVNMLF